jgi:hypothetical protein
MGAWDVGVFSNDRSIIRTSIVLAMTVPVLLNPRHDGGTQRCVQGHSFGFGTLFQVFPNAGGEAY